MLRRCALVLTLAAGCDGYITTPPPAAAPGDPSLPPATVPSMPTVPVATPPRPLENGWPTFAPTQQYGLRRLTSAQYEASAAALLGVSTAGMPPIEPVSAVSGFDTIGTSSAVVTSGGVAQFEGAAMFLAQAAFATPAARTRVSPCAPASVDDVACFRAFATTFGRRAFRRALTADELDRYTTLAHDVATAAADPWKGLEFATSAFLQSPAFLYLAEVGEADPAAPGRLRFTGDEMASRLAYFLTNTAPDDALLDAAAAGSLVTGAGVAAQTDRLLRKAEARQALRSFVTGLLALDGLDALSRPTQLFPRFTPTLGAALKQETLLTFEDLVFDRDGDYRELFTRGSTFANAELAAFYGLPAPAGTGFSQVSFPAGSKRLGLLGQAGVLAVHDHEGTTSPTRRGLFVLTRLLCQPVPLSPPAGLVIPPAPTGVMTARQRLEQHSKNAACASCHRSMDAVGLSLERFDALGVYRDDDRGLPIDDTGLLGDQTYSGQPGLAALVAQAPALGPCLLQAIYGSAVGHLPTEFDRGSYAAAVTAFETGHGRLLPVLRAVATSEGFRSPPTSQGP